MQRRQLIQMMAATGAASMAYPLIAKPKAKTKPLNILFLGGTGFLGPHTVRYAMSQGHKVTLFNRGKTNPHLFPELEKIKGDRLTDDVKQLKGRRWDAVIDTSAYYPRAVNNVMAAIKGNVGQYALISTISVYKQWDKPGMDESAPVGTIEDETTEKVTGQSYGPLKALCEQAAEAAMPGHVTNIRPGLIVGPGDKTDRFTYWPARVARGGQILAPGDGNSFIQFIDVRDLGRWIVYCLEKKVVGVYNAQSAARHHTMGGLLNTCVKVLNPKAQLVWVPNDFLQQHEVQPWSEMPVWMPSVGDYAGAGTMSSAKAIANGLTETPLKDTLLATQKWFTGLPAERQQKLRAGIKADKETKVIKAWLANKKAS
ncbi:SDR family oxidoreductase [Pleionea sp. CnH1-48]|uniref:SDR family oxidoreductase n=1 Tax=Pleionea sp. CnH1-48 TaxID=2954494 RepID=UPI002097E19C|nr:SDR family oxidoreductase [Pleionea sp. CnH1-48]MCO7223132.1 SDR family oxidoreductase [Pleionea sp. CnH1-48]